MRAAALLLAAGQGERMGSDEPKAFLRLAGKTLLEWAVETIEACPGVEGIVVAAPPGHEAEVEVAARTPKFVAVATGGDTRQASVRLALAALPPGFDVVICHDVARPLASPGLFSEILAALAVADGAVPVVPLADTLKRVLDGAIRETIPREGLALAQTPQAFRRRPLEEAHAAGASVLTDDAALLEAAGFRVATVPGDPANLKITRSVDIRMAEILLEARHG
jgi:2-C-methyl-D-erythritol 4-phosphate cytidylyltransferase/2-C-methyl-D-erythritol 2,4-cyclodiphosphate synthase